MVYTSVTDKQRYLLTDKVLGKLEDGLRVRHNPQITSLGRGRGEETQGGRKGLEKINS